MKVSFSLNKPKVTSAPGEAPSLKQPKAFASLDDDEPIDAAPTASSSKSAATNVNKALIAQAAPKVSKVQKKRAEAAIKVDESVFQYDEVWDKIQAAKEKQKQVKVAEAQERKVCSSLLPYFVPCLLTDVSCSQNTSARCFRLLRCGSSTIYEQKRR